MRYAAVITLMVTMVFFSCKGTEKSQTGTTEQSVPEQFVGKVMVSLMPDESTAELEADFSKFELKHLSIASRSQNQHLFEFNIDKISTEDLLRKLNRSKKVYLAEALVYKMEKAELMSSGQKKKADIK